MACLPTLTVRLFKTQLSQKAAPIPSTPSQPQAAVRALYSA